MEIISNDQVKHLQPFLEHDHQNSTKLKNLEIRIFICLFLLLDSIEMFQNNYFDLVVVWLRVILNINQLDEERKC